MKKITKSDLSEFIVREMAWKIYSRKYDTKDITIAEINAKDKRYAELWSAYAEEIIKTYGYDVGCIIMQLISYATDNGLQVDNLVNALRAMEIEVDDE